MNQRIQELALEAFQPINDITTEGVADRNTFDQVWFQLYNQKFAELIVKEMCDMLEQCEDDVYAIEPSERSSAYIDWLYDWRTRFEKHFGVTE
jgi:hypothetical protein